MGSRASQCAQIVRYVAEFPDQLGVAELARRRIPAAAERDRAGSAWLSRERLSGPSNCKGFGQYVRGPCRGSKRRR